MAYSAKVMWTRGQTEFVDLTEFVTSGKWTRKLDTWDEATLGLGPVSAACCAKLAGVRPWLHELLIQQDGETQFVGPITTPSPGTSGQIDAEGMAAWFKVRFVRNSLDSTGAPISISSMVDFIISSALSVSDPNLLGFVTVDDCDSILVERKIDATGEPPVAWDDQLQDIVGKYMHMSSYGRQLRFWCATDPCLQELAQLGAGDFYSDVPVSFDGDTFATRVAVYNGKTGTAVGDTPIVGYAGGSNTTYDVLVERKHLDESVTSVATAEAGAKTYVRSLPALIAGSQLGDGFELKLVNCNGKTTSRMQVGSCLVVTLDNACDPLTAFTRIEELTGTWGPDGESASITLAEQSN